MGELRREFLLKSISNLETLQNDFFRVSSDILDDDLLRRFFRCLHTIKGTANTFNLPYLAKLAHQIENLLQAIQKGKIAQNNETKSIFRDCFDQLLQMAQNYQNETKISFPNDFIEKLKILIPDQTETLDLLIFQIPQSILSRLSAQEKHELNLAIQKGKTFYLLKVRFSLMTFSENFKSFREILDQNGAVIAVASETIQNPEHEVEFQFFFVSDLDKQNVEKLVAEFSASIEFENQSPTHVLP